MGKSTRVVVGFLALVACSAGYADGSKTMRFYGGEIRFSFTKESEKEPGAARANECINTCEGKKHGKHESCDLSCDVRCVEVFGPDFKHSLSIDNNFEEVADDGVSRPARSHTTTIGQDFDRGGLPEIVSPSNLLLAIKLAITSELPNPKRLRVACWNTVPCSSSVMMGKTRRAVYRADYVIWLRQDDGTMTEGPKRTLRFLVESPQEQEKPEDFQPRIPTVSCKCEILQEPPKETGFLPGYIGDDEYALLDEDGTKRTLTGKVIASTVTDIVVHDMNRATFTVAAGPYRRVDIPAGWELECTRGGGQNTQLQENLSIIVMPWPQTIQVTLAPVTLRVLCLQIDKPEPTPDMTYRLVPPTSPGLARLARHVRGSSFRGPWDQTRLWIATDFASHKKISEVLFPPPSKAMYLREMHLAARLHAVHTDDPRLQKIMELELLAQEKNDPEAAAWLLSSKLRENAKATTDWIRTHARDFHAIYSDAGAPNYMARLARAALETLGDAGANVAATLLVECVPEQHRKTTADSENAGYAKAFFGATTDAAAAGRMLDWLEKAMPSDVRSVALNIADSLPANLKSRAAKLTEGPPQLLVYALQVL